MKVINLRSDTVTLPSEEMRRAMFEAELGDDVYGEDPTVNQLEEVSARLLGKEAGLFVASGTMGNLVALLTHCQRGTQAIAGDLSHIILHEIGGASALGGIFLRNVPNTSDGRIDLNHVATITADEADIHLAKTELLCVENTFHGQPLTREYLRSLFAFREKHGFKLHLDGARIFNAAIALDCNVADLTANFDSIQFCFSKGLAAPVGSMLCGDRQFIARARKARKMVGGGMRQVGVLAAACQVALEKMVSRLAEDHANAKLLADELSNLEGIRVEPAAIRTNMVFFRVEGDYERQNQFVQAMAAAGVLMGAEATLGIRAVTHYGIEEADIKETVIRIKNELRNLHGSLHRAGAAS
jgi:threonine aldolase